MRWAVPSLLAATLLTACGGFAGRAVRSRLAAASLLVMLVACDPSGLDDATATPLPSPARQLTEVGEGTVLEAEWSYAVGPDDGGWCTRLDVAGTTATRCGDLLPGEDEAFGEIGHGPDEYAEAHAIEGLVTDQAVTVWLVGDSGQYRIPARLMPLDEVGVEDAQAFVGFARSDVTLTHLQAVAFNGDVLQTYELP